MPYWAAYLRPLVSAWPVTRAVILEAGEVGAGLHEDV